MRLPEFTYVCDTPQAFCPDSRLQSQKAFHSRHVNTRDGGESDWVRRYTLYLHATAPCCDHVSYLALSVLHSSFRAVSLARLLPSLFLYRSLGFLSLFRSVALSLPLLLARVSDACEIQDANCYRQQLDFKFATLQYVVRACARARFLSRSLFSSLTR